MRYTCVFCVIILITTCSFAGSREWKIQIVLKAGAYYDDATWLGVAEGASFEKDKYDFRKPLINLPIPQVFFYRPMWDSVNYAFASDIRPLIVDGSHWDFSVKSPTNQNYKIAFKGITSLDECLTVSLIENSTGRKYKIEENTALDIIPVQELMHFQLYVGTTEYLLKESNIDVPKATVLGDNFPNPWNGATIIPLHISRADQYQIDIYNSIGQHITMLFSGWLSPGLHQFQWNGLSDNLEHLSSGLYHYQLTSKNGYKKVKKMLLMQ